MEYIRVTKENIENEHICCAISSNKDIQVISKKNWLNWKKSKKTAIANPNRIQYKIPCVLNDTGDFNLFNTYGKDMTILHIIFLSTTA